MKTQMTDDKIYCDFCKRPIVVWRYPCNNFIIPEVMWGSVGDWAACDACADYIEKDKLEDLAYLISGLQIMSGNDPTFELELIHTIVYGSLRELYSKFKANRKGSRVLA